MRKVYYLVSLGLTRITPFGLLVKGRNMVDKLTGNTAFPTPTPALADVTTACDELETAIKDHGYNPGPREKEARDAAFNKLKDLLVDLGGYVQAASNGDRTKIESAGLEVRKGASPVGLLPAPQKVDARTTAYPGRIEVRWGGVHGKLMYALWVCTGDPKEEGNWELLVQTSRNRYTADELSSDKIYYFRVVAIGTAGASPVSDVTSAKAA
jgi:hypothetical protein